MGVAVDQHLGSCASPGLVAIPLVLPQNPRQRRDLPANQPLIDRTSSNGQALSASGSAVSKAMGHRSASAIKQALRLE
jgi:hypothetical protein